MIIREIQPTDIDAYRAHRMEMLRDSPDAFLTTAEQQAMRPREFDLKRITDNVNSADSYLIGGWKDDLLVASMGVFRSTAPKRRHICQIAAVYVTPSQRGQGIGGRLFDMLVDHATNEMNGIEIIHLGVASHNAPAIALYRSRGFERYGTERHAMKWQGSYVDEDLMAKHL